MSNDDSMSNGPQDQPFDPQQALRVMADQTASSQATFRYPDHLMYLLWGAAYLLGYLPLALSRGPEALVPGLPLGVALGWFSVCLAAGIASSIAISVRHSRGMRGTSSRQGMFYGFAWWLAFMGVAGLGYRLGQLGVVDGDQLGIILNGVSMILVGTLFMAGGAIWADSTQFAIGAAVCVLTTVALVLGLPAYYWVMSLVVGGGMLVVGASLALRGSTLRESTRRDVGAA